ncbi:MAG: ribbon-helix-helix protein, CopG family [Methylacidiphilales bacterium]|nr:ribbon-helix-helix protein, CopG family [Candidatus Methylacidiphilales bacterium]
MTTTLTVRLEKKQREKLRSRARALGKSESELLREILDREFTPRRLGDVIGHLKGVLGPAIREPDEWQKQLRARNWRS